jgi:hypothetical protein
MPNREDTKATADTKCSISMTSHVHISLHHDLEFYTGKIRVAFCLVNKVLHFVVITRVFQVAMT